jgi:hypothetical protein
LIAATILVVAGCGPKADLTATELHDAYREVAKADALYKGKTIIVSGTVKWIGYTMDTPAGYRTVRLGERDSERKIAVVCQFPPESADEAELLLEGDSVLIRGVCDGETWGQGTPYLSKCIVLR